MKNSEYINHGSWVFLYESNKIEGENWLYEATEAMEYALNLVGKSVTEKDIKRIHKLHQDGFEMHCGKKNPIKFGEYRTVPVYIGGKPAMNPRKLPQAMKDLCKEWNNLDAWEVHCKFEKIHPFEDLNGRVGRLLWLIKAIEEGYDFSIPFLHKFYYQTLKHQA